MGKFRLPDSKWKPTEHKCPFCGTTRDSKYALKTHKAVCASRPEPVKAAPPPPRCTHPRTRYYSPDQVQCYSCRAVFDRDL